MYSGGEVVKVREKELDKQRRMEEVRVKVSGRMSEQPQARLVLQAN